MFILLFSFLISHNFTEAKEVDVIKDLSGKVSNKTRQYPTLLCGVYIKPSWLPSSVSVNGDLPFPAASLIKIPIAVALLRKIDRGEISWNMTLVLKRSHYAQGAGQLRVKKAGTKHSLRNVFKLMLIISDNTATNMVIDLLGGIQSANQEISKLGLKNTKLVNWLGDFKGTNKTSPRDLVYILERSLEGDLLSQNSKRVLRNALLKVNNKSLIKKGLGRYTKFAHKTGTIGICVGDAGIVYLPFWKRVGIAVIVRRPFNSLHGQKVIREISSLVYKSLN